jgi:pimeloyl-ACP methyl ester carboxylesterase
MSETTAFTHTVSTDGPGKGMTFTMRRRPGSPVAAGAPLVVALPGGTYTSVYFDVPGQSLLDTAETLGVPVIAVDRPGYLGSTKVEVETDGSIILRNAEVLDHLIGELWDSYGAGTAGVVVIGHSIGGAVTTAIAARHPGWPLLGIAVSGCLVRVPRESGSAWAALPDLEFVELPGPVKDFVMYGPDWTRGAAMPDAGHAADAPVPKAELLDITGGWVERMPSVAAEVHVPVHTRQGEFDKLWITDDDQVAEFKSAFAKAPWVDSRLVPNAGHCIDFHLAGRAFQLEQLAFALEAVLQARRPLRAGSPGQPDRADRAGRGDVCRRVAVDEEQVGAQAGCDAAAVGQAEAAGRRRGGGVQCLGRGEPRLDKQLELTVRALAVRHVRGHADRLVGVGAEHDRNPGAVQRRDRVARVPVVEPGHRGVRGDALHHHQGGHARPLRRDRVGHGRLVEGGVERRVGEHVGAGRLRRRDRAGVRGVRHDQPAGVMGGLDDRRQGRQVEAAAAGRLDDDLDVVHALRHPGGDEPAPVLRAEYDAVGGAAGDPRLRAARPDGARPGAAHVRGGGAAQLFNQRCGPGAHVKRGCHAPAGEVFEVGGTAQVHVGIDQAGQQCRAVAAENRHALPRGSAGGLDRHDHAGVDHDVM